MRSRRRGFTFMELTVAVSIIAILAAILFPVFAKAREKARTSVCQSHLHSIGMAMRVYSAEHFGHFPPTDNDLFALVPKYLPDPGAFRCPSVDGTAKMMPGWTAPTRRKSVPGICDYIYKGGYEDDGNPATTIASDATEDRHNEMANCLFLDGHVKSLKHADTNFPGIEDLRKLGPPPKWQPPAGNGD
jgi:prepilin-type N-terminal cleavage/methylation domain-containing protein/prepilin-type processing-associated H-X9-DG protein